MAAFITAQNGDIFQLDATTDVVYTTSGTLTKNPIEEGRNVSDHYIQNPDTVTFNGVLTRVKAKGKQSEHVISPELYIAGLQKIKNEAQAFTLTFFQTPASEGFLGFGVEDVKNVIEPLGNCVFETLNIRKQAGPQGGDLLVDFKAVQATFADQAQVVETATASPDFVNDASSQQNGVGGTTDTPTESLLDKGLRFVSEAVGV